MWMLRIFQEAINASFNYFLDKVKGRFWAFLVQLIVSYLAVAIFTLLITVVIISILNQGKFSIDLFTVEGLFEWMRMMDPVWTVTVVLGVNYLFRANFPENRMSFPDFYKGKSSAFWLDLVIGLSILAVVLVIYYKNEILMSFSNPNPLEVLLEQGFENTQYSFSTFLSNWIYYIVYSLPIVAIISIEVRERKRNSRHSVLPIWKLVLAAILMSFILYWIFDGLLFVFIELVMSLVYIPFELIEVPATFGTIVALLFKTLHFLALTALIHFIIKSGFDESASTPQDDLDINEI